MPPKTVRKGDAAEKEAKKAEEARKAEEKKKAEETPVKVKGAGPVCCPSRQRRHA